ncbi:Imm32 family immunity protein [Kribbella deserti]|uniref:Uncharacterized protein n=1 Tax=Kribbella deserti TaxID=1926257 RepID=A0ABV6QIC5_9ACTN
MELRIEVPDCGDALRFEWDEGFTIAVSVDEGGQVLISANNAGLVSLARHLLTLAQDGAGPGAHLHLTAGQEIDGDHDLVLERSSRAT